MSLADAISWALLGLCLAAAVWTDLRRHRVPNRLVAAGSVAALALALAALAASGSASGESLLGVFGGWAAGLLLGGLLLLPLYLLGGMAAGDVKLMAMVGAFLGPALVWWAALYALVAGGLLAFGWVAWCRWRGRKRPRHYPYAPAIALGCLVAGFLHPVQV